MFVKTFSTAVTQHARQITTKASSKAILDADKKLEYYRTKDDIEYERPHDWDQALPFSKIPGPKPSKIFGNNWRFIPKLGDLADIPLADLHKKFYEDYGDIMIFKSIVGKPDIVFLYSPQEIEKFFRNEGVWPIRDQMASFKYYRTKIRQDIFQEVGGLTTLQGEEWFKMRSVVNPILMQPRNAKMYLGSMNQITSEFLELMRMYAKLDDQKEMPETFTNDINKWSLESMGVIALDKHLGCLKKDLDPESKTQKMITGMQSLFDLMYQLEVQPNFWQYYQTKEFKKFVEIIDFFTFTILDYIREAKENMEKSGSEAKSAFQQMILKDERVATTMCIDMIMAGIDTTGKTLSAALYYLASNKEAQNTLRNELREHMPSKDSDVTKEIIDQAQYLKAVVKETTRLAPIAVGNIRSTQKDLVLCGYQIPKGTQVLCNHMYLCKRDEHFHRANEFLPERFLRTTSGELSHKNTHPFVFQPFGFGARSCIGKRLANLELDVAISKIIRNFELDWKYGPAKFESRFLYGLASPLKISIKEVED